jgi:SAM-dependent methyltransferase
MMSFASGTAPGSGHQGRRPAPIPLPAALTVPAWSDPVLGRVQRGPRQAKLLSQPTRGKTAPNRLRRVDLFCLLSLEASLRTRDALYVDLGFGAEPATTVETFARLRRVNPTLRVVGVEIDPARVAAAGPHAQPGLEFRLGGFDLPLARGEVARMIRAFNVLRQYDEGQVPAALSTLGRSLAEGGVLLEGTSDPSGRLTAFHVLVRRAQRLEHRWLVLSTNFRQAFDPLDWRPVLPKSLIHHAGPSDGMGDFFAAYQRAFQMARTAGVLGWRTLLVASARRLREDGGYPVVLQQRLLRRGFLVLGCPPGAPWTLGPLPLPVALFGRMTPTS